MLNSQMGHIFAWSKTSKKYMAFFLFALHSLCTYAQQTTVTVLENINVIDVRSGKLIHNQYVTIDKPYIISIDSQAPQFPATYNVIKKDYSGHFLIPGLFDMHVHIATNPSIRDNIVGTQARLSFMLKKGVTSIRDMAGDIRSLAYLSRQAMLDEIVSPDIYYSALMAGPAFFDDVRTHAASQGRVAGETAWMQGMTLDSDFRIAVAQARGTGAAGIKLYADLDRKVAHEIIQEAHNQEFLVWGHAAVIPAMPHDLVESNIDSLSHASLLAWSSTEDRPKSGKQRYAKVTLNSEDKAFTELINAMADKNIYLESTLNVYKNNDRPHVYQNGVDATLAAYLAGVPLIAGTDASVDLENDDYPPIIDELVALVKDVGITPVEAITAATLNSAKLLRLDERVGSIEPGKVANLVILTKNPLINIENLKEVLVTIKNGNHIH